MYTYIVGSIKSSLQRIREEVRRTAERSGRPPDEIQILAVSKTMPVERILEACQSGQYLFAENRIQEAQEKIPAVKSKGISWHFIGHLQSNKSRLAVELFDVIQTVHSPKLARRLNRHCEELKREMEVLIQVNIGRESQKSGVNPSKAYEMVDCIDQLPHLKLTGLMAIPPFFDDPEKVRPFFKALKELRDQINQDRNASLTELSMGMSGDYKVAIEEGSTILRLGTVIFGPRNTRP